MRSMHPVLSLPHMCSTPYNRLTLRLHFVEIVQLALLRRQVILDEAAKLRVWPWTILVEVQAALDAQDVTREVFQTRQQSVFTTSM